MDRLDAMTVFAAIADSGSLSAAGRRLGIPLATVSRKLSDLEAHLKTRLLARSTRQLALTQAGRDYLAACRLILEQVEEAEQAASGAFARARGELVIAAPIVFGRLHAVPVIAAFLEQHPEVDVRLLLGDRNVNLLEEHVDLALRIGTLPDSGLVALPVGHIGRVVCASPAYIERFGTPHAPDELRAHRCISFDTLAASSTWSFAGTRGPLKVPVHTRLNVTTADAAIEAALAGLGVTCVLSYQVAQLLLQGRLVRLLAAHELPRVPVNLVYAGRARLPMKCRAFIDHALPALRDRCREAAREAGLGFPVAGGPDAGMPR